MWCVTTKVTHHTTMLSGGATRQLALLRTVANGQVAVAHDECILCIKVLWADKFCLREPLT